LEQQAREVRGTLARAEAELANAEVELAKATAEFTEAERIINEPVVRRDAAWTRLVQAQKAHGKLKDVLFQGQQMLARLEGELKR
jgi:hypothetical protein